MDADFDIYKERWEALKAHPLAAPFGSLIDRIEQNVDAMRAARQARFDGYKPARPTDEPHDERCQITRWGGPQVGIACTCASNAERRRLQIHNAGVAGDMEFRQTLGSIESMAFDRGMKERK